MTRNTKSLDLLRKDHPNFTPRNNYTICLVKNTNPDQTYRELVSTVVEHVLSISIDSHDLVNKKLKENYNITTENMFEHPESLKSILINLYGNSYTVILDKIKNIFGSSLSQYTIILFLH